jgi:hypothetical protein
MKEEQTKVYVLIDPEYLKIRYIGITKKTLKSRLSNHMSDIFRDKARKSNWIKSLLKRGVIPIIKQIKLCNTRKEALELENQLILKYYKKFKLVNDLKAGMFDNKTARKHLRKPLYIYDYNGNFLKQGGTIKETAKELGIYYRSISKVLNGEVLSAGKYQFSRTKIDKMVDLNDYSPKNHLEILLKDLNTQKILRFKSMKECSFELGIKVGGTTLANLKASLNLNYGNRYLVWEDNKWTQSIYYNTGVIVYFNDGSIEKFKYLRDLATFLGVKPKTGFYKTQLINKLKKIGIKNVEFNKPVCEVIHK